MSIERYDTAAVYGVLVSAMGAGTILGALIGFRRRPQHPMRAGMLLALPFPAVFGAFALGLPIGYVLAGPLGEALGAAEVLGVGSGLALAALALTLTSREVRGLRARAAAASR